MHGERRRWRPTPREPTLSLGELLDASTRASSARSAPERQRVPKEEEDRTSRKKKSARRRSKNRPSATGDGDARGASQQEAKVVVKNMVAVEELEDPDERTDVEEELHAVLSRHGRIQSLVIDDATGVITAAYVDLEGARAAVSALNGSLYGSRALSARLDTVGGSALCVGGNQSRPATENTPVQAESGVPRKKSKRRSKLKSDVIRDRARRSQKQQQQQQRQEGETLKASFPRSSTLVIRNLLDPKELEDDDEFGDVYQEAHDSLSEHGKFERLTIVRGGADDAEMVEIGSIIVKYEQVHAATQAFEFYDGRVFGGRRIACEWVGATVAVRVVGMLDPKELEDPDEYEDVRTEVSEYFVGYKQVSNVEIVRESGDCIVECESEAAASKLISSVEGSKYGGQLLKAYRVESVEDENKEALIPDSSPIESIAEATAVQEAPSASSTTVTELAIALLQRLAALQERAHVQNPLQDKRSRRLVLGLHEVRRGISQQKIKLLVVGTDLEGAKPIRDAVHELVVAAQQQEIPVIYPMNRRKLGRVVKKSVRVSCVGIYSVDGANEIFKELLSSI